MTPEAGTLHRRTLLRAGIGGAATLSLTAPAIAQNTSVEFRMTTDLPDEAQRLASRLTLASDGRLQITITDADDSTSMLDSAASGVADLVLLRKDSLTKVDACFGLFGCMPMGMTSAEMEGWRLASTGQDHWDELAAEYGIKPFAAGDRGPQMLWSRIPLNQLGELEGVPVGSTGLSVQTFMMIGAEAVDIQAQTAGFDHLLAFEGLTNDQVLQGGLHTQFPFAIPMNPNRPMAQSMIGMNLLLWYALSEADKLLFERAVAAHHADLTISAQHQAIVALHDLKRQARLQTMPDDIWQAQRDAASNLFDQMALRHPGLVDGYQFFLSDVSAWSEIGEARFQKGRQAALGLTL